MATIRYFFRNTSNNKVSVYVVYRHGDNSKMFSTGIKINKDQWNAKKEKIDLTIGNEDPELIETLKEQSTAYTTKMKSIKANLLNIASRLELDNTEILEPLFDSLFAFNNDFLDDSQYQVLAI